MKTVETPKPASCPHCHGTGLCQGNAIRTDHAHQWLECDLCGKGIPVVAGDDLEDDFHRPVCATCGGKGVIGGKADAALRAA